MRAIGPVRGSPHDPRHRRTRARLGRGCFGVAAAHGARLRGLRVGLVDDVLTTGATAAELAAVLGQAGASEVQVWVVAHADRR